MDEWRTKNIQIETLQWVQDVLRTTKDMKQMHDAIQNKLLDLHIKPVSEQEKNYSCWQVNE